MIALPQAAPQAAVSTVDNDVCLTDDLARSLLTLRSRDGALTAVIAPSLGGAMVGLQWHANGRSTELLHRGMNFCPTRDFDGKAPTLWPATGRTFIVSPGAAPKPGWRWGGQDYAMPTHGFARDRAWRVVRGAGAASRSNGNDDIVLRIEDDAASRAIYPFRFRMTTGYRVSGRTVSIRYRVTAGANASPMPFSIGNHVTFALPLGGVGKTDDTRLSTAPRNRVVLDPLGRPQSRAPQAALRDVAVASLGRQTAVPLSGYGGRTATATLRQPGWGGIAITNRASAAASGDPVRFNLWGDAAAGYFAVEPWLGQQDGLSSDQGIVRLSPGKTFEWTVTLRVDARS